jgi:hypothetical protein
VKCCRRSQRCEKRHFLSPLYIKTNILPRQAQDKHRKNSKKSGVLLQVRKRRHWFCCDAIHTQNAIILPRQARDKHRKKAEEKKAAAFSCRRCRCASAGERKRSFLRHLYIKAIFLPRQARDKHRENSITRPFSHRWTAFAKRMAVGGQLAGKAVTAFSLPTYCELHNNWPFFCI